MPAERGVYPIYTKDPDTGDYIEIPLQGPDEFSPEREAFNTAFPQFNVGKSTGVQAPLTTPGQNELFDLLQRYLGAGVGANIQPYGGPLGVSLSALEEAALGKLGSYLNDPNFGALSRKAVGTASRLQDPAYQSPGDVFSSYAGPLEEFVTGFADRSATDFSNYFEESIKKPLLETFNRDVMPDISRRFSPSGFYSSQRLESEDRAREDLLDALTGSRAELGFNTREAALTRGASLGQSALSATDNAFDRALTAARASAAIEGGPISNIAQILSAAAVPRNVASGNQALRYSEFLRQQQQKNIDIQNLLNSIDLDLLENIVAVPGQKSGGNPLLKLIGTAIGATIGGPSGASIGGSIGDTLDYGSGMY